MFNLINTVSPFICYLADIAVVLFLALFAFIGAKRGLMKCLTGFCGTIVALLLALLLAKPLAGLFELVFGAQTAMATGYENSMIASNSLFGTVIGADGLKSMLESINVPNFLVNTIMSSDTVSSWTIPNGTTLAGFLSPIFAEYTLIGIMFFVLFIIFKIISFVVGKIIENKVEEKEVSNKINIIAGACIGFVIGLVFAYLVFFGLTLISIGSVETFISGTILIEFMCNYNLFGAILSALFSSAI